MTKIMKIEHPRLGKTFPKLIAIRMINGALHRNEWGDLVRFSNQKEAEEYICENFVREKAPSITVLV